MDRNDRVREAGHTLIEIVIIMVLIGILAFIAAPRFVTPKVRPAARQVVSDIQYAKDLALRLQTICGVYFINTTSYRVFQDNDVNKAAIDPVTGEDLVVTLSGQFSGVTVSPNFGDTLKFDALGTPLDGSENPLTSPPPNNIAVSSTDHTATIKVESNTGKLTVTLL